MTKRWLPWLAGFLPLMWAATGASQTSLETERALVNQYCVGCHNEKAKTGGLALDGTELDNVSAKAEIWEKVVRKLRARDASSGAAAPG